ncbi:hypothetical protein GH714_012713 [Hevea brasiliensis]|uniref:Uncharacterized protein n=1 Tax=Hevea brasiliensis TaxID=3981 RepID=A0A6A6KSI1_HEVBR|nr:hypothetical protein GH714_012713 [Hevea brasiliensis]
MEYVITIGEIAKTLLSSIARLIGHLISYNTNIKNLEKELQKLVDKKATEVDPRVDEAERNLEIIAESVIRWQKEVDDINQKGKEFLENDIEVINKCLNGLCPDPKSLYSLSRKAKEMTKKVLGLLQEAAKFDEITHPGPPPKIGSTFITEGIRDFESRESIKNEVWEALKDDKLSMISICGIGGVGKTTMVKQLVQEVERQKLFDEVAMAVVSQTPNIKKIQDLVRYGMGLRLFKNVDNVHQARDRVYALIDVLKGSFLLLEGDNKWYDSVKMHDLVRDVAISIGSSDKHWYTIQSDARMKEWREKAGYKNCTAISLVCEKINGHPNDLECPKLELLQLSYDCQSQSLPNNVFEGMKELKVLALALGIPSLPQSLDVLKNLRTLRLVKFESGQIHTIGALVKLEILEIDTDYLWELPEEIGLLKNLRLLDLRRVINLRYIPPGVLLGLSKLEELYVTDKFMMKWESKDGDKINASLSELETHHITALEITVPKASILPKDSVFRNLIRFKIFIGHKYAYGSLVDRDSVNVLHLEGEANDIKENGIFALLMWKTEVLNLVEVQNLKKVLYELEDYGFPDLKRSSVDECVEQEFLVDALERVPRSQEIRLSYFRNLREVKIRSCGKLKYFIPLSMARGLRQLHSIFIAGCEEMEGIFNKNEVDDEIEFPELKDLRLDHLPKFHGFIINKS